ncbi:MAG: hypothetical protein AB7H77_09355 [Bdellovibrionales bacterium]
MSPPASPGYFHGVAFASLIANCAAILTLNHEYGILLALALYLGSIGLTALSALHSYRRHGERFSLYLLPLLIATGPFGAGIGLIAALIYTRQSPNATSPSEWIDNMFDHHETRESDHLHERISFGLDDFESSTGVEPFRDILSGGGILQKQMAIAKIARYFRPAFAPLLLQAARDRNAAVRVQAATALAKIERDFMARYIRLENELRDLPDHDPAKLELAELYDDYAHADLLDDNNRQSLRIKSIHIYEACLAQHDDPAWRIKLARLYLRENMPEKSCEWLKPLVEAADPQLSAVLWYMEALFRLKRFGELRQLAAAHAPTYRISTDAAYNDLANLPLVWEGSGVWGKHPSSPPEARHVA